MRRRSEKYVAKGSTYAHWIGLYLSFHLSWVLGPVVYGRLRNLKTSEVTFAHVITTLMFYVGTLPTHLVGLMSLGFVLKWYEVGITKGAHTTRRSYL